MVKGNGSIPIFHTGSYLHHTSIDGFVGSLFLCQPEMPDSRVRSPCYSEEDTMCPELIKLAALGRRFQLGTLYDYRTDAIILGKDLIKCV